MTIAKSVDRLASDEVVTRVVSLREDLLRPFLNVTLTLTSARLIVEQPMTVLGVIPVARV